MEAAFAAAAEVMEGTGWATMCPVVTIAAEVADSEPELRAVGADVVRGWIADGTRYLVGRGLDEQHAAEFFHALLAALEGAFLLGRILRSPEPFHTAGKTLARSLR
jgi:hypothetical protein